MHSLFKMTTIAAAVVITVNSAFAQDQKVKPQSKEEKSEEIVIRKKGDKTEKMTIVVDGDKVTINGKPADEFKGDVTVRRKNLTPATAPNFRRFGSGRSFNNENLDPLQSLQSKLDRLQPLHNKAMLGILTQKAENGVKVTEVTKESGAEKAGLKKDDVITKAGNTKIETPENLVEAISAYKPNDKVELTYLRNGAENKTTVVLEENKSLGNSFNLNKDFNFDMPDAFNFNRPKMGLQIQDVEEGKGVKVKDVDGDSPAAKAGIKQGDVITQLNGKDVDGIDNLRNEIRDLKEGDVVRLGYKRDGKSQTAEVKIPKRLRSADL